MANDRSDRLSALACACATSRRTTRACMPFAPTHLDVAVHEFFHLPYDYTDIRSTTDSTSCSLVEYQMAAAFRRAVRGRGQLGRIGRSSPTFAPEIWVGAKPSRLHRRGRAGHADQAFMPCLPKELLALLRKRAVWHDASGLSVLSLLPQGVSLVSEPWPPLPPSATGSPSSCSGTTLPIATTWPRRHRRDDGAEPRGPRRTRSCARDAAWAAGSNRLAG